MRIDHSLATLTATAAMSLSLGFASSADAALLAYEGFDYTVGESLQGKSGGIGWSNNWTVGGGHTQRAIIREGSLSYLNLVTSGNSVWNNNENFGASISRNFANAPTTGTVYFSFLVDGDETDRGRYGAVLRPADGTVGPGAMGQSTTQFLNGEDGFSFRPDQAEVGGINGANSGNSQSIIGTNLLVVELNYDTNQASYWANPTDLGGTAPTPTVSGISFTEPTKVIEQFFFQQQDQQARFVVYDEFRVGTTYASVTPIPEPASVALLAAGELMLLGRRRQVCA